MRPITGSALLLALLVLQAASALAGLPTPVNAVVPGHVLLVGLGPAGPDSVSGHVTCIIRDLSNNPIFESVVTFDFSACTDLAIASDQADPRVFTICSNRLVRALTDRNGIAHFTIIGAGTGPERSDLDGSGTVNGVDLSVWAAAYFSGRNAYSPTAFCP
jgi:hypothetical protein